MDALGALYWLEKEEIKRVEFDLEGRVGEWEGRGEKGGKKVKVEVGWPVEDVMAKDKLRVLGVF